MPYLSGRFAWLFGSADRLAWILWRQNLLRSLRSEDLAQFRSACPDRDSLQLLKIPPTVGRYASRVSGSIGREMIPASDLWRRGRLLSSYTSTGPTCPIAQREMSGLEEKPETEIKGLEQLPKASLCRIACGIESAKR